MKTLKLIGRIIKNLFLILIEEITKLFAIRKRRKWAVLAVIVLLIVGGGYQIRKYYHPDPNDPNLSLTQAARIGQVTTHKLLVQIENRNCPPEIANGCYQRGDIVLIKGGDFQFSDAEKSGFLILRMDLTDKQADVLVKSLEQKSANQPKPASGERNMPPVMDMLAIRKYTVDLKKIGIADDMINGKEVDTIYKWDVVKEK